MRQHKTFGFSLIELMTVIAIIGILSAVALPNYRNYVTRSRLATGLTALEFLKTKSLDYYNTNGVWPANLAALNLNNDGKDYAGVENISSIGVNPSGCANAGQMHGMYCIYITFISTFIPGLDAPMLAFTAKSSSNGDLIEWKCVTAISSYANASIPATLLPGECVIPTS